nr:sigma-70 family RNA polymerase sigma factor [Stackebrandtia nassauensis]
MNPPPHCETTRLALAARGGDPVAVAAFVRATQTEVWRLCAALSDVHTADDLAQETYLRALKALASFEGRSSVRTWLLGIARRVCADHVRRLVRRRRLDARLLDNAPRTVEGDPAVSLALTDLLARLSSERRSAFVLTQVLGLSYADAAVVDNVPVGTIRSRVARAREELLEAWRQAATVLRPRNRAWPCLSQRNENPDQWLNGTTRNRKPPNACVSSAPVNSGASSSNGESASVWQWYWWERWSRPS